VFGRKRTWIGACLLVLSLALAPELRAQTPPCGYVGAISPPIDAGAFANVQDYGAPSARHQGRFHTGEDWALRDDPARSYGQYVRAIAPGRVTFSSPTGWGLDGGVIIIEHTFPDDSIAYSMYGHLTDATGVQFPAVFACVRQGDILAAISDARPVPHLHLEIRVSDGTAPGAGYTWDNPTRLGYRRPSKFIHNWSVWLSDAYRWRLDVGDETGPAFPPLLLDDDSLIYLDRGRLARLNPNGGVLWRVNLERAAVGLLAESGAALVAFTDGGFERFGLDGARLDAWESGVRLAGVLADGGEVVLQTADAAWLGYDLAARAVTWRADDAPFAARMLRGRDIRLALTPDHALITTAPDGALLDTAYLRESAALALDADGAPLVYGRGGLWRIDSAGVWSPALTFAPAGGAAAAVHADADGYTLFDGARLLRYSRDGQGMWQSPTPALSGTPTLQRLDSYYLLTTSGGDLLALRASDGALCNQARTFGDGRSRAWSALGRDGLLRVYVADQILALDWRAFLGGCG
jgi:murein DD-endopeptidase MepM/ murein hydrolase activator NlpD